MIASAWCAVTSPTAMSPARKAAVTRETKASWRADMISLRMKYFWLSPGSGPALAIATCSSFACLRSSLVSTARRVHSTKYAASQRITRGHNS